MATSDVAADRPLLFFSTRQGRQTNCVLTIEVARYVAERLYAHAPSPCLSHLDAEVARLIRVLPRTDLACSGRRIVLPLCHTSPLGAQACESRPDIPAQRQAVVPFAPSVRASTARGVRLMPLLSRTKTHELKLYALRKKSLYMVSE